MSGLFPEAVLAGPAPRGLGKAMVGGADKVARQALDYYPTPADVTRALIAAEGERIAKLYGRTIWEPCGRGGAIAREFIAAGFAVIASDVVGDPDNEVEAQDLLTCTRRRSDVVVTNPPFALADRMIAHLLGRLDVPYLALLLKSTFWHAGSERKPRIGLWRRHRPTIRYDLTWRPDFLGGGAPTMDCSWFVWDRAAPCRTAQWNLLDRDGVVRRGPDLIDGAA